MIIDIPKILYKYTHRKYATSMITSGEVKIGTLYEYRHIEDDGTDRLDHPEGTKSSFTEVTKPIIAKSNEAVPGAYRELIKVEPGAKLILNSGSIDIINIHVDVYILCLSLEYSEKRMSELGYDACVKIHDPEAFINAISDCMENIAVGEPFGGKCVYINRRQNHGNGETPIPPYLIKNANYEKQAEFRLVWFPDDRSQTRPMREVKLLNTGPASAVNTYNFWHPNLDRLIGALSHKVINCKEITPYSSMEAG